MNKISFVALLSVFLSIALASASPIYIDSCQTLGPGTYILTQNINDSQQTCFTIAGDNVTLDGNGYSIIGAGGGIYSDHYNGLTLRNLIIDGANGVGIDFQFSNNNIITNVSVLNSNFEGISLYNSKYDIFTNVISSNSGGSGVSADASHNNKFINFTANYNAYDGINLPGGQVLSNVEANYNSAVGIRIFGDSNLSQITAKSNNVGVALSYTNGLIKDSELTGNIDKDIIVSAFSSVDLLNVSYDINKEGIYDSYVSREWYVSFAVQNNGMHKLSNVNVSLSDVFGNVQSLLTDKSGKVNLVATQYILNAGTITNYNNYTAGVEKMKKGSQKEQSAVFDLNGNKDFIFTI